MSMELRETDELLLDADYTLVGDAGGSAIAFWAYNDADPETNIHDIVVSKINAQYFMIRHNDFFRFADGVSSLHWTGDIDFHQRWRHFVVNFWDNVGTPNVELFIDAVSQGTKTYVADFLFNSIGEGSVSSSFDWFGKVTGFACYTTKLTQVSINQLHYGGTISPLSPLLVPDLDMFFPMLYVSEGVVLSGTARDLSGQGRNGTYQSSPVGRAEAQVVLGVGPLIVQAPPVVVGGPFPHYIRRRQRGGMIGMGV